MQLRQTRGDPSVGMPSSPPQVVQVDVGLVSKCKWSESVPSTYTVFFREFHRSC